MLEWPGIAITATYLAGVAYCVHGTWGEQRGCYGDICYTVSAVIWPILFVWDLYQRSLIRTYCPFTLSDRHDFPWLVDEFVPGFAT